MSDAPEKNPLPEEVEQSVAAWLLRCDRGLTPTEQDDFLQWLAADPRHGARLALYRRSWQRLDQLALWCPEHGANRPNPDLLAPSLPRRLRWFLPVSLSLAAAAAIMAAFLIWPSAAPKSGVPVLVVASAEGQRILPDGSVIELNHGAVVSVSFTATERRVRLEQGEAYFTVAKDRAHPFIVTARGVDVRAVGTTFNVRMDAASVEVLVTEGHVQITPPSRETTLGPGSQGEQTTEPPPVPLLAANQQVVVSLTPKPEPPEIATLTPREIERMLAWQRRLLNFTAAPLSDIVAEFNRHNTVQLVLSDPKLTSIRLSASFYSDNIAGFLRLLEAGFGVRSEYLGESEIVLH